MVFLTDPPAAFSQPRKLWESEVVGDGDSDLRAKAELLIGLMRAILAEMPIEERHRTLAIIRRNPPDIADRLEAPLAAKH